MEEAAWKVMVKVHGAGAVDSLVNSVFDRGEGYPFIRRGEFE